eukprot:3195982-Prymnesium_polylepis.1
MEIRRTATLRRCVRAPCALWHSCRMCWLWSDCSELRRCSSVGSTVANGVFRFVFRGCFAQGVSR